MVLGMSISGFVTVRGVAAGCRLIDGRVEGWLLSGMKTAARDIRPALNGPFRLAQREHRGQQSGRPSRLTLVARAPRGPPPTSSSGRRPQRAGVQRAQRPEKQLEGVGGPRGGPHGAGVSAGLGVGPGVVCCTPAQGPKHPPPSRGWPSGTAAPRSLRVPAAPDQGHSPWGRPLRTHAALDGAGRGHVCVLRGLHCWRRQVTLCPAGQSPPAGAPLMAAMMQVTHPSYCIGHR